MFEFKITAQDGKARVGEFTTPHGIMTTPAFMPVGTHGAVKSVSPAELQGIGTQIILSNTYHLYLRPGDETIKKLGGLHQFMRWPGPILTDSGGFQVFSLGEVGIKGEQRRSLRKVTEEGILFQSHLDGSSHLLTPEKSITIQQNLGADIMMAFDQPVYGLLQPEKVWEAMTRTKGWLARSKAEWERGDTHQQALFGIVQGGIHTRLHQDSAKFTVSQDLPGNAIGGLSVGEGKEEMWQAVESINQILPEEKPRYFMGVGEPSDLIGAIARGIDLFDCVLPTRLARHGNIWMLSGEEAARHWFYQGDTKTLLNNKYKLKFKRLNLRNTQFKDDTRKFLSPYSQLPSDLIGFSYATLHHYLKENEMLGYRILSLHNIEQLNCLVGHLIRAIQLQQTALLLETFGIKY